MLNEAKIKEKIADLMKLQDEKSIDDIYQLFLPALEALDDVSGLSEDYNKALDKLNSD